jgi:hypothetical protein
MALFGDLKQKYIFSEYKGLGPDSDSLIQMETQTIL